jgi:hypothetical protein
MKKFLRKLFNKLWPQYRMMVFKAIGKTAGHPLEHVTRALTAPRLNPVLAIFIICVVYTILVVMFFLVARYFWRQRLSSRRYYEDDKEDYPDKPPAYDQGWRDRGGWRDNRDEHGGLVRLVKQLWRTVRGLRTWGSAETAVRELIRTNSGTDERGHVRSKGRQASKEGGRRALRKLGKTALQEAEERAKRRRRRRK